jgi:uncharacterized protein YqcC (DUF446 family)
MAQKPRRQPDHAAVAAKIAAIEAEMKRIGLWQSEPLPPQAFVDAGAFGINTMAFAQWLQFVFVPRVRQIVAENGEFPDSSDVGVTAVRNFDGFEEAAELTSMLGAFDALIEGEDGPPPRSG